MTVIKIMAKQVETTTDARAQIDSILISAIDNRASDIHFEPEKDCFNIRFRIDGFLYSAQKLEKDYHDTIISRIKVLSQINITERRFPQDGHFEFEYRNKPYNIRVSTFLSTHGEVAVLRILNRDDILIEIENLGFSKDQLSLIAKLIKKPNGMIIVNGPSGSGKTTLLYSMLNTLNKSNNNIISLEDPVELQIDNIRQIQVNQSIGFTFSKAMRAVLRQDPNIIMVGEIRDSETAQIAIQAALTGILVFSTFHTLDAPGLIARFSEMDIPRSSLSQAIAGIVSVRLMRKICPVCKAQYKLTDSEKTILGIDDVEIENQKYNFQKGRGCDKCHKSGYLGRTGVFEIAYFDNEIRSCILEKSSAHLVEVLRAKQVKTLRQSAREKVLDGITTVEEMLRLTNK